MMLVAGDLLLDVLLLPELRHSEQPAGMMARSGGSAANTAAWIEYLGYPVRFVGCVGDDPVGDMLRAELRAGGVQTSIRVIDGVDTGCVAVQLDGRGERLMRSSRGANVALAADDLLRAVPAAASVAGVHLTGYALLGVGGFDLLHAAGEVARSHGVPLSFDPSSEGVIHTLGRDRLLREVKRCGVQLLLPNMPEARALTDEEDIAQAAVVLGSSAPTIVVKCSERGAISFAAGEVQEYPTEPVTPLDTTGAGDAFNAGLLVALRRGGTLVEGCHLGHVTARRVIESYGGRPPRPKS